MFKNSSLIQIIRALWKYTKGQRLRLVSLYSLFVFTKVVDLASPYVIGQIINTLQAKGQQGADVALHWVLGYAIIRSGSSMLDTVTNTLQMTLGHYVEQNYKSDFYKKAQSLPLLWHQDHHSGDILSRMYKATGALRSFVYTFMQGMEIIISFGGPIFILMGFAPLVGGVTFAVGIIAILISIYFDKRIRFYTKISNDLTHSISGTLSDYISNIRTIITLRLGSQTHRDLSQRMQATNKPYRDQIKWRSRRWFTIDFFVDGIIVACIAYMIYAFKENIYILRIGDLVMVINYLRQMSTAMYSSSRFYGTLSESILDYQSADLIETAYDSYQQKISSTETASQNWSEINIENLNFSYKNKATTALSQLSFTMHAREKIALVGASGGGKSTLMSVLRGLYPATNGTMEIDGKPCTSIEPLAAISTLIPQDPEIFENTIRYNITLGVDQDEAEILEACHIACFDSVLADLPKGLDSKINEKGVNLSGGQKQRLALARGIFAIRNSSLVLFDEPTSSVDSLTERRIYSNLFAAFPDICLISSIHRLNLLNQFDTIWVMQQGRMVQQGKLNELLKDKEAPFYALWHAYQDAQEE